MNKISENKGFSLIELIVAISMLSVIAVAVFNSMSAIRTNHLIEEHESGVNLREISKSELLLQGIDPNSFNGNLSGFGDIHSTVERGEGRLSIEGKNKIAQLNIHFDEERERTHLSGKVIKDIGNPILFEITTLQSPKINYAGKININDFPLKDFVVPGDNPLGTYYRFTVDGTSPTENSPVWNFDTLELVGWAPVMQFRAFNEDERYLASDVVVANVTLETDFNARREKTAADLGVSFREIMGGINRVELVGASKQKGIKVHYQVDEGSLMEYSGPFHVPLNQWKASGVHVKAILQVEGRYYSETLSVKELNLYIKKEQLMASQIIASNTPHLRKGDSLTIQADRSVASTITTIEGMNVAYEKGAEIFKF